METASTCWNMFSNQNQPNPLQQTKTQFGTSTFSQQSSQPSLGSPMGSTGQVFNTSPVSYKSLDRPQSNPASGAPSTNIFGVPSNLGWGFQSTPSIFQSNSTHPSTNFVSGVPSVMSLAPESAKNGFRTSIFCPPTTNNTIGSGFPSFGSTSSSVSSSLFGPQSSRVFSSTPFQNISSSASTFFNSSSNKVHEIQNSESQCKTLPWAIGLTTGKQCKGSSVAPYSATRETNGANGRNSLEKMQSISAMLVYSDKSHEELRMEDYELRKKGGNTSQGCQSGFKHFDIKDNIYSRPTAFNFSAPSTLSDSPHFVTPAATTSSAPTLTKPANTVSPSSYTFSPRSHSFQPQSTVASSISSFTLAPNTLSNSPYFVTPAATTFSTSTLTKPANTVSPSSYTFSPRSHSFQPQSTVASSISSFTLAPNLLSSLNPFTLLTNNHHLTPFSTTSTSMPFNTLSSNKQPFTFSPSVQSTFQPGSTLTSSGPTFSSTPNLFSFLNPVTRSMTTDNCLPSFSKTSTSSPFNTTSSSESSFTFTPFIQSATQSQSTITSPTPAFTVPINPFSSLNQVDKSISSNNCQFPKSSAVQTFPLPSMVSSNEPLFTFSPCILSALEKTLGPSQSFLNASQTGQAVQNVNFSCTTNQKEPLLAQTAFTKVSQVDSENVNVQQSSVSSSTVNEQLLCIQNPFGPQIEVNISNCQPVSRISIQTGISSLPVSDNPSPVRKAPHLRIRHWSSRQNRYPAQRLNSGSKELKVPFFSDTEDKPCTVAPLMPRVNPRSWVSNSSYVVKNAPLNTRDNGAEGSENKALATSSSQPEGTSPETTDEISIQEENFDGLLPLPKLRLGDYYTEPPISLLAENERAEPGFCSHVHDFVVGRRGYGSIKFLGQTDVRSLDLESIVQFNKREVTVYLNDSNKPQAGQSLNKPAEVTLLNVKCIDKQTGIQYTDGEKVHRYRAMLIKKTEEIGAEFISYNPVEGAWKFRVRHF